MGFLVVELAGIGASPSATAVHAQLHLIQTVAGIAALIAMMVTGVILARARSLQVQELSEELKLLYATSSVCCASLHSMEHTGTQVRIAAQGPQAFRLLGVHDMSEVFHLMAQAMGAE